MIYKVEQHCTYRIQALNKTDVAKKIQEISSNLPEGVELIRCVSKSCTVVNKSNLKPKE